MERLSLMFRHRTILGIAMAVAAGAVIVAGAGLPWLWALAAFGVPAQMVNEYGVHRFVFHLPPPARQWQFDLLYRAHYGHHDFPTNRELIFAPDFVVFPMLAVNFTLVWGLLALFGVSRSMAVPTRRSMISPPATASPAVTG